MVRVNVAIEDRLLEAIDAEAANSSVGRSVLIQSALTWYLDARRTERDEACRGMDALAEKLGAWNSLRVLQAFRAVRPPTLPT